MERTGSKSTLFTVVPHMKNMGYSDNDIRRGFSAYARKENRDLPQVSMHWNPTPDVNAALAR